jgi:hypothetical protein
MHWWIYSRNYTFLFCYFACTCVVFETIGYKLSLTILVVLFPYLITLTEQQLGFSITNNATVDTNTWYFDQED